MKSETTQSDESFFENKTDVPNQIKKSKGFIEKFMDDVLSEITDSPDKFKEACSLSLLSSSIGRKMFFINLADARLKDILDGNLRFSGKYLNLWFIMIGKSRVSRKTTVIRWVTDFIKVIDKDLLLPDGFTPQALISELSKKYKNDETRAVWLNDEVSGFFQQIKETKFMIKTDSLLSKIYDGDDYKDATIQRGREEIKKPYLTTLLASTDVLPKFFDELFMLQGFGNRFIYCIGVRSSYKPLSSTISQQLKFDCVELVEWLKDLNSLKDSIPMGFDKTAHKSYVAFEKKVEQKILDNKLDDIKTGYAGSLPTTVLKLACIYAISDHYPKKLSKYAEPLFLVEEKNVKRAVITMEEGMADYSKVLSMMRTKRQSIYAKDKESELIKVLNIIKYAGKDGISRTALTNKTRILKKPLDEIIETLEQGEEIEIEIVKQARGKDKKVYRIRQ